MTNSVKVITSKKDSTEILGVSTNNPEFGYIRVEENGAVSFGNGGWLNSSSKTALIKGKTADLQTFINKNNVRAGYELSGQIVIIEQTTPFYAGQQPKINPSTSEVLYVTVAGIKTPIYRQTEFTQDMTRQDSMLQHENVMTGAGKAIQANEIAMK
tara:strand:- start:141 stop:608 length:468 start_codon:yes stop_codon:yes gene_type:complete